MSLRHRWSPPCLWLALLAYLLMSGFDDVHTHVLIKSVTYYRTSAVVIAPDRGDCPICTWHAMANAPCRLDTAFILISAISVAVEWPSVSLISTPRSATRARAPPEIDMPCYA